MRHIVLVGNMKVGKKGDTIVTYALGTSLGLMAYDPVVQVGGLLHAMLPLSRSDPQKAATNPCIFVDTGVPKLFKEICDMGGQKSRLVLKAAGCARPVGENEMFKIGERNYSVLKKILWKNSVLLESEDVGGVANRTVHFDLITGEVKISN
ncbi:MAG TPA: chemotaxis protein CheD [Desulfobacterales bacterium]|nr:MAG: chemotaxis protein CheD [Deltaproteobacteria bacterium]HHC24658.1 chemotaxis protein CheD [Desulfobacterales bacterium]